MTPPPAADEPEYLKVEEVAARLKLKDKTIRDWILRGELPAYKLGKEWRIRRDDFDQAMQARRTTAEPAPAGGLWDPDEPWIASSGSLQPLRSVCILHRFAGGSRSCVASHLPGRTLHRGWRGRLRAHDVSSIRTSRPSRTATSARSPRRLPTFSSSEGSWPRGRPPVCWMQPRWLTYWGAIASGSMPMPASSARFGYGDGPKARIGFDLVTVEQWKRDRQIRSAQPARGGGTGAAQARSGWARRV